MGSVSEDRSSIAERAEDTPRRVQKRGDRPIRCWVGTIRHNLGFTEDVGFCEGHLLKQPASLILHQPSAEASYVSAILWVVAFRKHLIDVECVVGAPCTSHRHCMTPFLLSPEPYVSLLGASDILDHESMEFARPPERPTSDEPACCQFPGSLLRRCRLAAARRSMKNNRSRSRGSVKPSIPSSSGSKPQKPVSQTEEEASSVIHAIPNCEESKQFQMG